MLNGDVSFWWSALGEPARRPPLDGSRRADVCIVGAGYTGLWTAYALKRADPSLDVVVLEARFAGYGASGRNGGWLTHDITGGRERYLDSHGRDAVNAFQREMDATVDEVIRVTAEEGIDADVVRGGELEVATTPAQQRRMLAHVEQERASSTSLRVGGDADQRGDAVGAPGRCGLLLLRAILCT